jgi:hypothetical protein
VHENGKAESQLAEKQIAEKYFFQHLAEYANGRISSGPPFARARFSPLNLDLVNFTV